MWLQFCLLYYILNQTSHKKKKERNKKTWPGHSTFQSTSWSQEWEDSHCCPNQFYLLHLIYLCIYLFIQLSQQQKNKSLKNHIKCNSCTALIYLQGAIKAYLKPQRVKARTQRTQLIGRKKKKNHTLHPYTEPLRTLHLPLSLLLCLN